VGWYGLVQFYTVGVGMVAIVADKHRMKPSDTASTWAPRPTGRRDQVLQGVQVPKSMQ
jgi:hypothetical protein